MEVAILFGMVIGMMLIGVPIAVSLGLSSIFFLMLFSHGSSLASVAQTLFSAFEGHYTLLAIPFFILASVFMSTGGVANRIIRFAVVLRLRRCLRACCLPRCRARRRRPWSRSVRSLSPA